MTTIGFKDPKSDDKLKPIPLPHAEKSNLETVKSADCCLHKVKCLRDNKLLLQPEVDRLDKVIKSADFIMQAVLKNDHVADLITPQDDELPQKSVQHDQRACINKTLRKLGYGGQDIDKILDGVCGGDQSRKSKAYEKLHEIFEEKADSLTNLRIIAKGLQKLAQASGRKTEKFDKLLNSIDRLSNEVVRLNKDISERRDFELVFGKKAAEFVDIRPDLKLVAKTKVEGVADKGEDATRAEQAALSMLDSSVEALQKVQELMVEIAEIEIEMNHLESKAGPFKDEDEGTKSMLYCLGVSLKNKRTQMSNLMSQTTWRA